MAALQINDGSIALVDDCDAHLARFVWYRHTDGYVFRRQDRKTILLHREILGISDPRVQVDHENRNPLDNTRTNLRRATNAENHQNLSNIGSGVSQYRGVSWNKNAGKWLAGAKLNQRNYNLGYYDIEIDAGRSSEAFRRAHMPFASHDIGLDPVPPCGCRMCRSEAHRG